MLDVLIVVDMQNDFIDGSLGTKQAQAIVPKVAKKIRDFNGQIYFTRDTHHENYLSTQEGKNLPVVHCIEGTKGWELAPEIEALRLSLPNAENPFDKDAFGSMNLALALSIENDTYQIGSVTLVGLCTDICVISNAALVKAALPEVPVYVDASCCAGVTPESHERALKAMQAIQIHIV